MNTCKTCKTCHWYGLHRNDGYCYCLASPFWDEKMDEDDICIEYREKDEK
jgi:hypothetical protein